MALTYTAEWFDKNGEPCEPKDAETGEIRTWDEQGINIERTYMEPSRPLEPMDSALGPWNLDLGKTGTWDLWAFGPAGSFDHHVRTLDELLEALRVRLAPLAEQREAVSRILVLPVWVPAPDELKQAVYAWLRETRPVAS